MKSILIAAVAYAVNVAYAQSLGDDSLPAWSEAPQEHRDRILAGVQLHIDNPDTTPEQAHVQWLAAMTSQGWTYGEVKDVEAKKHPCILPFDELPQAQRSKDSIFRAVVHALKDLPDHAAAADAQVKAQAPRAEAAAAPAPAVLGQVAVQYIGRRPSWSDRVYDTGLAFSSEQVRILPEHIARLFLRHPDLFKKAEVPEPVVEAAAPAPAAPKDDTAALMAKAKAEKVKKGEVQREIQEVYDQIDRMDKDGLIHLAATKYQQPLSKQAKVETLRAKVRGMVDQFGVV